MTCIITGCVATRGHQWVGGDLHAIGNCFVFNCIVDVDGNAAWSSHKQTFGHYSREIDFSFAKDVWERRGTIIAPATQCILNPAAKEFLRVND